MSNESTSNANSASNGNGREPVALEALRRAADQARQLARQTRTPAWIMSDGKLVDATQAEPAKPTP